ncbi:MAG: DUF2227 family putative metal-binding protein [Chlamydiales bacterium]|nr:DUF2227 family putative metal-binding protein [Chlamydiales bacterium]
MSSYKTHVTFNLCLALPAAIAGIYYIYAPPTHFLVTFISAFFYGTCFMNPDLDLIHQIKLFSLRGFLTLPFRFYSKFFKHRGLSHSLLFGTATRILWLSGMALLLFYLVYQTVPSQKTFLSYFSDYKLYALYGLAGIILADWCHLALDHQKTFK